MEADEGHSGSGLLIMETIYSTIDTLATIGEIDKKTLLDVIERELSVREQRGYLNGKADARAILETMLNFYSIKAPEKSRVATFNPLQFMDVYKEKYELLPVSLNL